MNVVITGVNGFIGQHLARELIKNRHFVIGLGRSKTCAIKTITAYYSGTILDAHFVDSVCKEAETIVHLAALTAHRDIIENKFETLETNFSGTKCVLDAFLKSQKTKKFFYASTGKVYGKIISLPITEDHPTKPLNILGKSKRITEQLIDFYNNNQKEFTIFRIFNMYGPMQKENFLIPTILTQIDKRKTEIELGDIEAKRDYVYIDDVIRAFMLAIDGKVSAGLSIYNICTGVGLSASEIVNMIGKIKKVNIKMKSNPVLFRDDEMKVEYGSFALAKKNIGWEPKISLQEGLERLIIR